MTTEEWTHAVGVLQSSATLAPVSDDVLIVALTNISTTLKALRGSNSGYDTLQTLTPLPVELVFACLAFNDDEIIELGCDIIQYLIAMLPFAVVLQQYKDYGIAGLQHPHESVRTLALKVFEAGTQTEDSLNLLINFGLFEIALRCLSDKSTTVSLKAADLILKATKFPPGLEAFLSPGNVAQLLALKQTDSMVLFRVYGLVVQVASQSESASLQIIRIEGLLPSADDFRLQDPLSFLNVIEICIQMTKMPRSLTYMQDSGVITAVHTVLAFIARGQLTGHQNDADLELLAPLIAPSVTRFIGELSPGDIEFLLPTVPVLDYLVDLLQINESADVQEAAVTAVGNIGSTLSGLRLLSSSVLGVFVRVYAKSAPFNSVVRAAFHVAAARMLAIVDPSVPSLTQRLLDGMTLSFKSVSSTWPARTGQSEYLVVLISDVNDDARWAGYSMLQSLTRHSWGRRLIICSTAVMEHLLNRETESEKIGVEWKYFVLSNLNTTDGFTDDDNDWKAAVAFFGPRIQRYLREGVFYKPSRAEVAEMVL